MKAVLKMEDHFITIYKVVNELFLVKIRAQHCKPAHTAAQQAGLDVAVLFCSQKSKLCSFGTILTLRVNK